MKQKLRPLEVFMNLLFFVCGLIAVVFVLFISIYLIVSGLPAIREIGLVDFLFGTEWADAHLAESFFQTRSKKEGDRKKGLLVTGRTVNEKV